MGSLQRRCLVEPTTSGGSGSELLFTDNKDWGTVYCYTWGSGDTLGEKQFKISIPSGTANIIFSNGNGAQTVDIPYSGGVTGYYIKEWSDDGKATVGSWK